MALDIQRLRDSASQLCNLMPQRILDADLEAVKVLVAMVDDVFATPSLDGAIAALEAHREKPAPEATPLPDVLPVETEAPVKSKASKDVSAGSSR